MQSSTRRYLFVTVGGGVAAVVGLVVVLLLEPMTHSGRIPTPVLTIGGWVLFWCAVGVLVLGVLAALWGLVGVQRSRRATRAGSAPSVTRV